MQISSQAVAQTCAICDRSLLTGERAVRYAPQGGEFLDVCPLCQEIALEYGWVKEGTPTTPTARELAVPDLRPGAVGGRGDGRVRADSAAAERARTGHGRGGRHLQRQR